MTVALSVGGNVNRSKRLDRKRTEFGNYNEVALSVRTTVPLCESGAVQRQCAHAQSVRKTVFVQTITNPYH